MKTLHTIYTNFAKRMVMLLMVFMTIAVETTLAQDEVVYTLTPKTGSNNSYAGNCDITINDITWNLTGNSQQIPWRIGGKSLSNTDRALYSKTAIQEDISKIVITHGEATNITVNSMKVIVSTNQNGGGTVISTLTPTFKANGDVTITRPDGKDWSKAFYKIVYNVTVSGDKNKFIEFTSAQFYKTSAPACSYTVTFNGNGNTGGSMSAQEFNCGESKALTTNAFTKTGHTFAGWNTEADGSGDSYTDQQSVSNLADNGETITLFAQWTAKTSTISFDQNGGEGGQTTSVTATYGQNMPTPITLPTRFGHTFDGYYDGEGGTGTQYYKPDGTSAKAWNKTSSTAKLFAKWIEKGLVRYRTSCACIPPAVTIQPTSEYGWRYSIGETIGLNAIVEGASGDCTYQWQKYVVDQWQDIAGATSETFTKENCTTNDGGSYRCVVDAGNDCTAESEPYYVRVFTLDGYYYNEEIAANKIEWTGENTGVATIHLGQSRTYLFKVTDNEGKWFGYGDYAHFNYIVQPWQADCGIETGNGTNTDIRLFTGPEGDYTFTINIEHALDNEPYVNIAVAYPEVEHPVAGYGYITKWWDHCYIHWWDNNDQALTEWGSDAQITTYTEICETEYYFFPIIDNYINLIIKDKAGDPSNTTEDQTQTGHSGWYITHDGNSWGWHEFATYTITFVANGGNGTMDALSGICPTTDKTLTPNAFTRSGYTFAGWKANKNVTINGVSIVAGTLITDCATIQNIVSDITLTAQWTPKNITITWDANGGSVTPTSSTYTYNGATITPPTPTRANYIFNGWFTAATGGTKITEVGTNNKPTENVTYYAQWTEKATPTFAWSAATCTAALEADNTFPTLNNPNTLPVTYTSSNTDVATIDANGNITLVATGPTTITAIVAETDTHKSATTTYELTVVESNCRWVEVTDNTTLEDGDEVVITMGKSGKTYALPNAKRTTSDPAPEAIDVTSEIVGNEMTSVANNVRWTVERDGDYYVFYTITSEGRYNLYCNSSDNGVCVAGSGNALTNHKFKIEGDYLKSQSQLRYLSVSIGTNSWRSPTDNTTSTYSGQTLKFYKRECLDATSYWVTWDAGEGTWEDKSSKKLESYQEGETITEPAAPSREGYRFDGWTPTPETMPAQNTTFTAKWTKVYTITWYENGVPSYTYVPSDNPIVTWEDGIADCGEKKFYGWTADNTFVSHATTPPACIEKGITIDGDVTYYAVYADAEEPANPGYEKVTTISEGTYLIATGETENNKAYTGKYPEKTYGGTCDVIVENQVISTKPTSAVEVEVTLGTGANSGKFAIYDGTYYLSAPDNNNLTFNDNIVYDWKLTAEGHINSTGYSTRYIQLNSSANPNRFACYSSSTQTKAYLYKKQTTTYKNFAVSCATYEITITPPTGGKVTTNPTYEAGAGQTITVNVTPDDCKYLTALKYNDGSDHSINISSTPYTFTMPAAVVTVTATFADKTATDIEVITSAHRMLMQGSAFVGEQVRITYNNGDTETLNWNDSRLTFTGHNTATLGSQTVTVTYNDCGTQSASYNIEVIDGLGITFWDGNYTEVVKYEPGDLVDVDSRIGQNICSGWEFAGWSETKVANESEEYVPVHNFNATDAKVLYAVYVKKKAQWTTIVTANEAKSGAKYVLAYDRYDTYYALTSSVKDVNYLAGKVVTSTEGELNSFDVYYLSAEPTADLIWELVSAGENGKWYLYNKNTAKYIDLSTQGQIHLTDLPSDKLQMESGYNDSQIRIASSTVPTYYLSWDNSNTRYNTFASSNSQEYWYTKDEEFTSTPPCSPLSATFHGNGGIVTDGVNSGDDLTITEPTRDAGITTPTASFADCDGKSWTFVGWAREELNVTRVPVLTTDLLHDGGGDKHYDIQEDGEEFWAVFTNTGNPETKYGTITFTDDDVTRQYENAKTITKSVTAMGDYEFELYHVSNASNKGIQFDNNVATKGYIKNITSLGKINSISLNDFQEGDIDDVKVYVGNMPNAINTLLTEADLQQTGNTYTYYPQKKYAYVKIEANGYCGITSISIDFGKGTQIWATTPDCSTITLSGDEIYITATNGRAIMASAPIAVKANQLEANADVILTSNSSDVYFSLNRDFNFAAGQAADQKPTTSLTLPTDAEGNLATTDVYIHYMPSSEGDGVPANVIISANLETPNPSITDDHTIHVRNLPAKFVIATKVGATWYALPANMTGDTNPLAEVIEVDEATMTATAPNTTTYTLWPVKTTNGTGNRYAEYGDRVRFAAVNYEQRGLWANNNNNSSAIRNYAVINSLGADGMAAYEWKVTTTVVDGHWQYTLQTDQTQNQNYLRYWTSAEGTPVGPKWGTYNAGENKLYFLPVTETQPFEYAVVEWYPTKVLIQTDVAIASPTVKVGGEKVASPILTTKGGKLYEISNLPLETNPNKLLQVSFTDDAINYTNTKVVPIILSRGAKTITGEPFATLTQKVYQYADVVVRDGATLSIDGTTDVANTLLGVTIYPTAKVSVEEGKKLSVHSLTFFGGIDEIYNSSTYEINKYGVPQLSLKGILNKTITNMDYIMRVDLEQMYQVGVPYDVNLSDITYWDCTAMTLGDNLYVSAYDGQKRANLEPTGSWVWEVNFEVPILKAGIGYTISADKQDAAHEYSIIRMPMKNNITSGNTEIAKTVQVYAYANTNDVEITDNNKGWNYLSNPYMAAISGAEADSKLVVGYLDRNEVTEPWEWVNDTYRYVTIPSDDGTYHYQQKFKDAILNPFKSFFLQIAAEGELSFDLASRQSAPARYLQTDNEKREVEFEVLLANDTRSDNLGFLIGEDYTPAYEINADLEKMIGSMSVYTIYNGYNLAYNALSPANAEEQIPIGYVVPTVGEYTWALDESSNIEDVEHIYLIDYETSAITDLVTDVYTFTASEQKSDTRFAINVTLKSKESTVTGLVNINKDSEQSLKFIHNDKIYILHNGVIYDATGKFVETINK